MHDSNNKKKTTVFTRSWTSRSQFPRPQIVQIYVTQRTDKAPSFITTERDKKTKTTEIIKIKKTPTRCKKDIYNIKTNLHYK
jgi:hypothetical protein